MKEEAFKQWLRKRNISERPISDYVSRCRRVERDLNIDLDENDFFYLTETGSDDEYDSIEINGNRKSGIASFRSAITSYWKFLNESDDSVHSVSELNKQSCNKDKTALPYGEDKLHKLDYYTKKEIENSFLNRLKTQDRIYPELKIIFWPRLFVYLFKEKYTDIIKNEIENNISCSIEKDGKKMSIPFQIIKGIYCKNTGKNYQAYIEDSNGTRYPLLSNGKAMTLKLCDNPLGQITLDHKTSIHHIVENMQHNLTALRQLYDLYMNEIPSETAIRNYFKDTSIRERVKNRMTQYEKLFAEIVSIHNAVQMELMSYSDNSGKGK